MLAMSLRRGLLLAAINLAVAIPLVLSAEARLARLSRLRFGTEAPKAEVNPPPTRVTDSAGDVAIDPCVGIFSYPVREQVARLANIPAATITGWRMGCPARWTVAGRFGLSYLWVPTPDEIVQQRKVDIIFLALIALQWLLVGSFPLIRPKRWYMEPGALITICAVLSGLFAIFPSLESFPTGPVLVGSFAWLYGFGLLIWRIVQLLHRAIMRPLRTQQ